MTHLDRYRAFLRDLEAFAAPEVVARHLTDDAQVFELPNRLVAQGRTRDRAQMLEASTQAPKVLSAQRYVERRAVEQGDLLVIDLDWQGTLKVPLGQTPAGGTLDARITAWARFRDGRICELTNFDCYQPF
ncbi:MAG: nuclear transport factor 2 family protein [Myxococcaceae bacterium]